MELILIIIDLCYPAVSPLTLFTTLGLHIITSFYIFYVPLPILWMARIQFKKKLGLVLLVTANMLIIAMAIYRAYEIAALQMPGDRRISRWTFLVPFIAVVTTNIPLFFPLVSRWTSIFVSLFVKRQSSNIRRQLKTIRMSEASKFRSRRCSHGEIHKVVSVVQRPTQPQFGLSTMKALDSGVDIGSIDLCTLDGGCSDMGYWEDRGSSKESTEEDEDEDIEDEEERGGIPNRGDLMV